MGVAAQIEVVGDPEIGLEVRVNGRSSPGATVAAAPGTGVMLRISSFSVLTLASRIRPHDAR